MSWALPTVDLPALWSTTRYWWRRIYADRWLDELPPALDRRCLEHDLDELTTLSTSMPMPLKVATGAQREK